MKEEIKSIILEYCEGIYHLEFDADKLDEIAERIEKLSKLHQPAVSGFWTCERCGIVPNDKVTFEETHEGCGGNCH